MSNMSASMQSQSLLPRMQVTLIDFTSLFVFHGQGNAIITKNHGTVTQTTMQCHPLIGNKPLGGFLLLPRPNGKNAIPF